MSVESPEPVRVVAGILYDQRRRVLVARRPSGKAFAGRWEFPGGKIEDGETAVDALVRELAEELGVDVEAAQCRRLLRVTHRYPGAFRSVSIEAWVVDQWSGAPRSLDGQGLAWHLPDALPALDVLEADRPIVTALRLGRELMLPRVDLVVHEDASDVRAADHPASLSAAMVADAATATTAVARGADVLLVQGPVDEPLATHLERLGRPWYVPSAVPAPDAFTPTGRWSR